MAATGGTLSRLKQPEYTGENRCMPCTVVNTIIAGVLSIGLGIGVGWFVTPIVGFGSGLGLFALSLGAIYFRGYLVPGTPELTQRYFPAWILAYFGKGPAEATGYDGDLDPERELMAVDALEECRGGADLCLTDGFRDSWYDEIQRADEEDAGRDMLMNLLGVEDADIHFQEYGDAFRASADKQMIGKWESKAAFLADVGGGEVLRDRHPRWDDLEVEERSQLLNGLRLFIDRCPSCGGDPEFETDTVESCCSTHEVAAVSCTDCDVRLFESHTQA